MTVFGSVKSIYMGLFAYKAEQIKNGVIDFWSNIYKHNKRKLSFGQIYSFAEWEKIALYDIPREVKGDGEFELGVGRKLILKDVIRVSSGFATDYTATVLQDGKVVMEWRRSNGRMYIDQLRFSVLTGLLFGEHAVAAG